ncbi:globin family protein [Flavobacterium flavipallidum]|uniref:Group 1 truncated hemoglobin n=1 Tax=Flavobacterium flavipallidum TaxID=3139140 RepID=A0ABU9HIX1_9FLAO
MRNFSKITLSVLLIASAALTSCSKDDDPEPVKASIYARLGGTTMVADPDNSGQMIEQGRLSFRKVVNSAIGLIVADITNNASGNLKAHFAPLLAETGSTQTTSIAKLSDNLTDFFSFNTGGTNAVNAYSGLSMAAAHNPAINARMGAKSTDADYTKFEGYVGAAANANGVASNTELYADIVVVLESLRSTIVQM